jgi:hypothetical protein
MCHVDSDESVPEAPECIQLKPGLDTQHKTVLLQLRINWRLIKPILVENICIIVSKSVNPKPHRDSILWVQVYGLLFHRAAQPADISWRDKFIPAAVGRGIMNGAYLGADQRKRRKYRIQLHTISLCSTF